MSTNLDEARRKAANDFRCKIEKAAEDRIREIAREEARAVAEDVYAGRERAAYSDVVNALDPSALSATSPTDTGAGEDLAARIASVTSPHRVVMVDIKTTGELVEIARDAGQAIADLEQRLADAVATGHKIASIYQDRAKAAERERDAARTSLEAMERRVGELEGALRAVHARRFSPFPVEIREIVEAALPDAGEGK